MNPGEIHVWCVRLDTVEISQPTPGELARAAHFRTADLRRRYLRSHAALRVILSAETEVRLDFAVTATGKPFLPAAPRLKFNLAHSHEIALVGLALDVEIGVDVERIRPIADYPDIALRFFPPSEAGQIADQRDFFLRWTRLEAIWKARGLGIYGAGIELAGEWTAENIDAASGYAAAAAAPRAGMRVVLHDFGANQ